MAKTKIRCSVCSLVVAVRTPKEGIFCNIDLTKNCYTPIGSKWYCKKHGAEVNK